MLAKPALLCYTGYTSSEQFVFLFVAQVFWGESISTRSRNCFSLHTWKPLTTKNKTIYLFGYPGIHVEILVGAPPSWFFQDLIGDPGPTGASLAPSIVTPNLRFQKFRGRSRPNAPSNSLWIWRTCDTKDPLLTRQIGEVMAAAFESEKKERISSNNTQKKLHTKLFTLQLHMLVK